MKLLTRQEALKGILAHVRLQAERFPAFENRQRDLEKLEALPWPDVTVADVEAVLPGRLDASCDECGKYVRVAVKFGEGFDDQYDPGVATVCKSCVEKGLAMMEGEE